MYITNQISQTSNYEPYNYNSRFCCHADINNSNAKYFLCIFEEAWVLRFMYTSRGSQIFLEVSAAFSCLQAKNALQRWRQLKATETSKSYWAYLPSVSNLKHVFCTVYLPHLPGLCRKLWLEGPLLCRCPWQLTLCGSPLSFARCDSYVGCPSSEGGMTVTHGDGRRMWEPQGMWEETRGR